MEDVVITFRTRLSNYPGSEVLINLGLVFGLTGQSCASARATSSVTMEHE